MAGTPSSQPAQVHDEIAEQRRKHAPPGVPQQRADGLSEPDREQYELRLDEYEVMLAGYRAQMAAYAAQLEAAHHDGLTGTWLRSAGFALLQKELHRADRSDSTLSVAFVDVDGLKAHNDTHGHAAGDAALRTAARTLLGRLRAYDHVIRWGGDEFLCVLPGATEQEATQRLEQACRMLAEDPDALGISVGIVERLPGEGVAALVERADRELYGGRRRR